MVRNRRLDLAARLVDSSLTVLKQAVRDAEAIVCTAWAEELLQRNNRTAIAFEAARQECRVLRLCGVRSREVGAFLRAAPRAQGSRSLPAATGDETHRTRGESGGLHLPGGANVLYRTAQQFVGGGGALGHVPGRG